MAKNLCLYKIFPLRARGVAVRHLWRGEMIDITPCLQLDTK